MIKKSVLLGIVAIILLNLMLPMGVRAAPSAEDSKWVTITKLNGYDRSLDNNYNAQYGLYYNLYYLTLSTRWTSFLYDFGGTHGLGFSEFEKEEYRKKLIEHYKSFNLRFSKPVSDAEDSNFHYYELELKVNEGKADFMNMTTEFLNKTVISYLESRLEEINAKIKEAGEDEALKDQIYQKNKNALRYIWKILDVMLNEEDDMKNLLGDNATLFLPGTGDAKNIRDTYSELIEKGREIDQAESKGLDNVEMAEGTTYVEKLSFASKKTLEEGSSSDLGATNWKPNQDQSGPTGQEFKLRDSYIRMFSASAVYRPLVSHVGDDDFLEAMGSLFPEANRAEALQLYDELKDYRKPLYSIYDSSKWYEAYVGAGDNTGDNISSFRSYAGQATPIKLKQFMEIVKEEDLTGLVMMKGKLEASSTDLNSYFYYSDNPRFEKSNVADNPVQAPVEDDGGEGEGEAPPEETPTETESKGDKVNNVISQAGDTVTSKNWTSAVLEVGGPSRDLFTYQTAGLTLAMLNNIYKDHDFMEGMPDKEDSYLFMNPFGDIVTDDNLVVVPGASNPIFYDETKGYTPYNVTFMSGYPNFYYRAQKFVLGSESDKGKFVLVSGGDEYGKTSTLVKIKGEENLASTDPRASSWVQLALAVPIENFSDTPLFRSEISAYLTGAWNNIKASVGGMYLSGDTYKDGLLVGKIDPIMSGTTMASYDPAADEDYGMAKYIAKNAYMSFRMVDGQVGDSFSGKLREDFIFRNVLVETLNGTVYAKGYTRTLMETYANMQEGTYGGFTNIMYNMTKSLLNSFGWIEGVLGVKDSREDPIFGSIMIFTDKYFWPILIVLFILFVIKFMKNRSNFTHTISVSALAVVVAFAFLKFIPHYMPSAYNFVLNNVNERLSYDILLSKSEKYVETYKNSGLTDKEGKFLLNTTSINLYSLTDKDLEDIYNRYKIEPEQISKGNSYILDPNTGLYLEGSNLKINVDSLLYTNPITGGYEENIYGTTYQLTADKAFSSVIDYYTPYYLIQDGLVESMNKLLQVYKIPKHTINYKGGLTKDSFLMYNYTNSMPFLSPADYSGEESGITGEELDRLTYLFDNPESLSNSHDFLNLNAMLENLPPEGKDSLWWRTLVQNEIIGTTPESAKRYNKFIEEVNFLTKRFMISVDKQIPMVSDENMIKIVSLYATVIFNQKASEFNNHLYPKSLNYQDYKLEDVYLAAYTNDFSRFAMVDRDIAAYMAENSDPLTMIAMMGNIILGALISFLVKWLLPLLYIAVGGLILSKFVVGKSLRSVVFGYLKISALIFVALTLFVSTLSLVSGWSLSLSVWATLFAYLFIAFIMYIIVSSVLMNFTDMGNERVNQTFKGILDKLKNSLLGKTLNVRSTNIKQESVEIVAGDRNIKYTNDYNLGDDLGAEIIDLSYAQKVQRSKSSGSRVRRYVFDDDEEVRKEVNSDNTRG